MDEIHTDGSYINPTRKGGWAAVVRAGKADSLTVLDDEIACLDRLLPSL